MSYLSFEDFCEVVDYEVIAFIQICAQQDAGLLKVFSLKGLARGVRKEDPIVNWCKGAAHDPVDYPVPFRVDHFSGISLTQARSHVADLILKERKHA